jgi:hypothetical protein
MLRKSIGYQSASGLCQGNGWGIEKTVVSFMSQLPVQTRKFIDAVHRRLIVTIVLENMAIFGGVGALAGLIVLPIFWWRGEPGWPGMGLLGLGLVCGLIRGIGSRPTRMAAATEADRQLKLHDLLGTVLSIGEVKKIDEWQSVIVASCENRVAGLRPSDVLVARLGLRAWGGVGVATALLLTLSILTARPADLRAAVGGDENGNPSRILVMEQRSNSGESFASSSSLPRRSNNESIQDESSERGFQQDKADNGAASAQDARDAWPTQNGNGGGGTGMAITQEKLRGSPMSSNQTGGENELPGNQHSGGDGKAGQSIEDSADATGGKVDGQTKGRGTSDWQPGGASNAQGKTGAQQVPDWAGDLLRDYFQRD